MFIDSIFSFFWFILCSCLSWPSFCHKFYDLQWSALSDYLPLSPSSFCPNFNLLADVMAFWPGFLSIMTFKCSRKLLNYKSLGIFIISCTVLISFQFKSYFDFFESLSFILFVSALFILGRGYAFLFSLWISDAKFGRVLASYSKLFKLTYFGFNYLFDFIKVHKNHMIFCSS